MPQQTFIGEVDACIASRRKTLNFPSKIEALFDKNRRSYRAKAMRSSVAPSIVCYNIFLPADWILAPATFDLSLALHMVVTGWFLIAGWAFKSKPAFAAREMIGVSMPVLMVLQVLTIYVLNEGRAATADYQYLAIMIVVFMNVNLRPDFRFAIGTSAALFLCYAGALMDVHAAFSTRFVGIATMAAAIYLTLIANWRMERDARHAFLRSLQDRLHRERAEAEAGRDPLTGLFNRRHLKARADALWREADAATEMAVLMLDIDNFKGFNDRYGHLCGDQCLKQVAATIGTELRVQDVSVRYGGEEFVVILPRVGLAAASKVAERIRRVVEDCVIVNDERRLHVTVSIGLASGLASTFGLSELIAEADVALYKAKVNGRNRVWPIYPGVGARIAELRALNEAVR